MRFGKWKKYKNTRWKITDKMFFSLAVTGIVIEFSHMGSSFIDGLITSNFLGANAMAAIGIVTPVFSLLGMISGLIAVGMQMKCTEELGRGNVGNMNRFFSAAVIVGGSISVLVTAFLVLFPGPFVALLGASGNGEALAGEAADYARGIGYGAPALILCDILAPAMQVDSGRKTIQTGAIIAAVADVLLDLVAVRLNTGVLGIALATTIANYLNLLYQCTHFLKKNRMLRFVKPKVSLSEFGAMLVNGCEKAIKRVTNIIRPIILNTMIISLGGTAAMTAFSIQNSTAGFAEIFLIGIAEAVALLTGLYYGEVNAEAISEVGRCAHRAILRSSGLICLIMLFFARPIAGFYIGEEGEMKEMVVFAIRMLALENPLYALINSRIKYLQGVKHKLNMNLLIFVSRVVFITISAFGMGALFGAYGILACFAVSDLLTLLTVIIFYQFKTKKWVLRKYDYLDLSDEFKLGPGDVISLHVRDRNDMSLTSEQIQLFCKGHRFSPRIGYYAALVFEELTNNIITHGFPLNKAKEPVVDVRMVAQGNRLILRLRDNCPQFDIMKKIAEVNAEDADSASGMGIRITAKIAKNIRYASTFETNNIIIEYEDEKAGEDR